MSTIPVGPDVSTPSLDAVVAAVQSAPRGDDWPSVSRLVIPVLPRVRPYPPGHTAPLRTLIPPGVMVSFGIDIGPAFMAVAAQQLSSLNIAEVDLVTQSLANLSSRADEVRQTDVVRQVVEGVPVDALQTGRSIASTLILLPDQVRRLFGAEPRTFIAPMRDVLLGFPSDVSADLVGDIYELIASQDPNCLPPTIYRFDGTAVSIGAMGLEAPLLQRLLA